MSGADIATCPSCSLQIKVIFDDDYMQDFIKEKGISNLVEAYWASSVTLEVWCQVRVWK